MASYRRAARREWSVEESAIFAARRDFELLKLLAAEPDKKVLATARRLKAFKSQPLQQQTLAPAGSVRPATQPSCAAQEQDGAATGVAPANAQKRRSAVRSARRHAAKRSALCRSSMLALLFVLRLRRAAQRRRMEHVSPTQVDVVVTTASPKRARTEEESGPSSPQVSDPASSRRSTRAQVLPQGGLPLAAEPGPSCSPAVKKTRSGWKVGFLSPRQER